MTNAKDENAAITPDAVEIVYANRWLRVREQRYTIGGAVKTYTIIDRDHTVVIIPVSAAGRTLLVRQYRFPTEEFSWELPMGGIDAGESFERAAARELVEETGIRAERLSPLGNYRAVPGLTPQRVHVFLATVTDDQLDRALAHANVDDIQARRALPLNDLFNLVAANEITDGFTLASLMLFRSRTELSRDGFLLR